MEARHVMAGTPRRRLSETAVRIGAPGLLLAALYGGVIAAPPGRASEAARLDTTSARRLVGRANGLLREGKDAERALFTSLAIMVAVAGLAAPLACTFLGATPVQAPAAIGIAVLTATWSSVQHAVLFAAVFAVFALVRGLAAMTAQPARTEFWAGVLLVTLAVGLVLRVVVFRSVSFAGGWADALAFGSGGAVALALAGLARRRAVLLPARVVSGMDLLLAPLALTTRRNRAARIAAMAVLAAVAAMTVGAVRQYDWNFLVQTLSVVLWWIVGVATLYVSAPRTPTKPMTTVVLLAIAGLSVAAFHGFDAVRGQVEGLVGLPRASLATAFADHAGVDPSFRVVRDWLEPPMVPADRDFADFLLRNTNIAVSRGLKPITVDFFGETSRGPTARPHVFVFVIDSLRPDYLSPYNRSVTFTPAIDAFAHEPATITFRNSFTAYGATGLSEPSIWVGGRTPHQQYIEPFSPMNALQHLLDRERYHSLVSMDSILRTVLAPSPRLEELDATVANKDYDLCRTVEELAARLPAAVGKGQPVFVYTQPQPLHIASITRGGGRAIDAED